MRLTTRDTISRQAPVRERLIMGLISLMHRFRAILCYGTASLLAMVVDVLVAYTLAHAWHIVAANTAGILAGFTVQYLLSIRRVFNAKALSVPSLAIYLGTFVFGIVLADAIMAGCFTALRHMATPQLRFTAAFAVSKAASVIIPFFLLYSIRKHLFSTLARKGTTP